MSKHEITLGPIAVNVTIEELRMILDDAFDALMEMTGAYEEVGNACSKEEIDQQEKV